MMAERDNFIIEYGQYYIYCPMARCVVRFYYMFNIFNLTSEDIPEAVAEACGKCTPAQKHLFKRFLEVVKDKLPQEYEAFKTKYDPQGKHFDALLSAVANS